MSRREIWVVPFFGQGHLFPCMELCKHIASRDFQSTLIISSNLSTSIPSSLRQHPHIQVFEIPSSTPPPPPPPPQPASASDPMHQHRKHHEQMALALQNLLSTRPRPKPVCAILDIMIYIQKLSNQNFMDVAPAYSKSWSCQKKLIKEKSRPFCVFSSFLLMNIVVIVILLCFQYIIAAYAGMQAAPSYNSLWIRCNNLFILHFLGICATTWE